MISYVLGKSGRAILDALVAGETNPGRLIALCSGSLKASRKVLIEALRGRVTDHHRFLLKLHLGEIDLLQQGMRDLEARMGEALEPFRQAIENLTTISGIRDVAVHVIAGEVGLDMSRFAAVGNLISWARFCPQLDESASKHRSTRIRKGAPWLKTTLVSAACAAVKTKGTYLQAQFQRLRARRGPKKAIIAVAASMLTAAYYILRDGVPLQGPRSRALHPPQQRACRKATQEATRRSWFHGRSSSRGGSSINLVVQVVEHDRAGTTSAAKDDLVLDHKWASPFMPVPAVAGTLNGGNYTITLRFDK